MILQMLYDYIFQTGSVVGRSYTQDGEYNNAKVPITQLTSNSGSSKMQMLIGNYNTLFRNDKTSKRD